MYDLDDATVAKRLKQINGIKVCTNPCIEFWFLLHFKSHRERLSSDDAQKALEEKYPNYKKGDINDKLFGSLMHKVKKAVDRAEKLTEWDNPSSTVYRLIQYLEKHS